MRGALLTFFQLRTSQRRDIANQFGLTDEGDPVMISDFERDKRWLLRAQLRGSLPLVLAAAVAVKAKEPGI